MTNIGSQAITTNCTDDMKVVCYYPNWAYWREGNDAIDD